MLLQRRGKTYYVRARVPADLVRLIGRGEIKQSLRTTSYRDAKALTRMKAGKLERIFSTLRLARETMDEKQLKRVADKLLADFIEVVEQARRSGKEVEELQALPEGYSIGNGSSYLGYAALTATLAYEKTTEQLDLVARYHANRIAALREEIRLNRYSEHTRRVARRWAEQEQVKIQLPPKSWFVTGEEAEAFSQPPDVSTWSDRYPEFTGFCRVIAQTLRDGHEVELERVQGVTGSALQVEAEKRVTSSRRRFTLNDLWKSFYQRHATDEDWAGTTGEKYQTTFVAALHRVLGEDFDFSTFEEPDRVTELIQKLKEYKSLRTRKKWGAATVNDCIVFLSTLYNYAIENRNSFGITYNPFRKRQIAEAPTKKESLTKDELKAIWTHLLLLKTKGEEDKYWVILLLLYTGARIGEVCQLRLNDVENLHGRWVIHYRYCPETQQNIKGARRKLEKHGEVDRIIAIHPDIKALGFLRYIEKLKQRNEVQVFPKEKRTNGRWGVLMGKKVKTFFVQCGIEKKSSHHCRHTFVTWYKQNCSLSHTDASLISSMIGHEDDSINGGNKITWETYGGPHLVNQMYNVVKKLNYGFLKDNANAEVEEAA